MRTIIAGAAIVLFGFAASPSEASTLCPALYLGGQQPAIVNQRLAPAFRELCNARYAVGHSGVLRVPIWSAETISKDGAKAALATSGGDYSFAPDDRLPPTERSELSDYARSGLDRGHLTPSGNFASPLDDAATFLLSNVVPQHPCLNQRTWRVMEGRVLKAASKRPVTYVVTGPLFEGAQIATLKARVYVPTHTWKAIYAPGEGAGVYVATNPQSRAERPRWQMISVDELTRRAGVDPFPALDAATRQRAMALTIPKEPRSQCKKGR